MFNRDLYYSQSEACKLFKLSPKKFKQLVAEYNIPLISIPMELHSEINGTSYNVTAKYVLKTEFQKIMKK